MKHPHHYMGWSSCSSQLKRASTGNKFHINWILVFDDFLVILEIHFSLFFLDQTFFFHECTAIICTKMSSIPLPAQRGRLPGRPSEPLDFGRNLPEKVKFGSRISSSHNLGHGFYHHTSVNLPRYINVKKTWYFFIPGQKFTLRLKVAIS